MDEQTVISKCYYFRQINLWPRKAELDFEAWLENFLPAEREYAISLLHSFVYFSDSLTQQLFQSCFHAISSSICRSDSSFREAHLRWKKFVERLIVTRVTGEVPNDTDSGFRYVRMARQNLGIQEKQIVQPEEALRIRLSDPTRPLVFVDDFLGSGQQFKETWEREHWLSVLADSTSFSKICNSTPGAEIVYCVPVSTDHGINNVLKAAPSVKVESAHILGPAHSVQSPDSLCWPSHLKHDSRRFIVEASARADIPERECFGFHGLGLTVAFEHSVPDATIPIVHTERNGWKPLRRRR